MTHDEIIEVIAAHRDGKMIQFKAKNDLDHPWCNAPSLPNWNFQRYDYRIEPAPLSVDQCWDKAMDSKSSEGVLVAFLELAKENGHV